MRSPKAASGVSEPARRRVLVRRDGSERLITGSEAPILSEEGAVIGVVLVLRDITREQRVEEEAKKAPKLESLGILAGGIAHDFNNLLTAILGNVNLAQRYVPAEGLEADTLAGAHEACLRARDLTKQLLTFASGGAPVKRTGSIVDLLRDSVRFALRGSNVRCEFSIAWVMPRISLRSVSEAIRPAGSSRPRLIRSPVLRRSSRIRRSAWLAANRCVA